MVEWNRAEMMIVIEEYLDNHPTIKAQLTWGVEIPGRLTGRERLVMRLRLGFEPGQTEGWTQQQVGKDPRIERSRSTVSRIERSYLAKLGVSNISKLRRPVEPPIKLFP